MMSDKDPIASSGDVDVSAGESQAGEDNTHTTHSPLSPLHNGHDNQDTTSDVLAHESDDEELQLLMGLCNTKDDEDKRPQSVNGTCFLFNELMTKHKHEWSEDYPERPERITRPFARCCELGLVDRCQRLEMRYATEDLVQIKHSEELLEKSKSFEKMSMSELLDVSERYSSWFANNSTYECSLAALGSTVEVMENILKRKSRNGFAMIRPPGHHAMFNEFCGYCTFNNIAIAAQHALDHYQLERILIVDWDIHHGQATQYMFYDDPRVLYFSIHRYDYGTFWPELRESDYDFIGKGKGKGYNINVPLNKTDVSDSDYLAIFYQLLLPVAYEYSPQLILVSSGFDAAIGCPEFAPQLVLVSNGLDSAIGDHKGEMRVSPATYAHFVHMLSPICEGRVCVILEGGYCLKSLSEGCALALRSLLGDPCPLLPPMTEPSDSVTETILNVIKVLQTFWECFQYQEHLAPGELCPFKGVNELPPKPGVVFVTEDNQPEKYDVNDYFLFDEETFAQLDKEIDHLIAETSLAKAPHRTCLVFDADMRAHRDSVFKAHPERPDRISRIYNLHVEWGLYKRCLKVQSRLATEEEILYIHSESYLDEMKKTADMELPALQIKQREFNSVYLCKDTYHCGLLSAGSVLNVVDTVLSGEAQSGVAIVRPPGHHAESSSAMGFCFFNNIAIAAKHAQIKFGVKRILILDWDVHHPNGTQHQFYDDDSVLLISLHRFDHGFFYPMSKDGNYNRVGEGSGEGFNVNIPWNNTTYERTGTSEYIAAFHQVIMPIAYEFAPELILVSAGFDAARGDPLGGLDVTPEGFGQMTHMLSGLANGKVVLILEGGYNLNSISASMATCTSVLLGDQCPLVPPTEVFPSAVETVCNVLETQRKYWKSLKFRVKIPSISQDENKNAKTSAESKKEKISGSEDATLSEVFQKLKVESDEKSAKVEAKVAESSVHVTDGDTSQTGSTHVMDGDTSQTGSAQVMDGDTSQTGSAKVTDGDTSQTGSAQVTDGDTSQTGSAQVTDEGTSQTGSAQVTDEGTSQTGSAQITGGDSSQTGSAQVTDGDTSQTRSAQITGGDSSQTRSAQVTDGDTSQTRSAQITGGDSSQTGSTQVIDGDTSETGSACASAVKEELEGACGGIDQSTTLQAYFNLPNVDQMYAVQPLHWCPHLDSVMPLRPGGLDVEEPCQECGDLSENWVCLVCYKVFCSRFVNEHMLFHGIETEHRMVLSYADLSVWCYGCDNYVDHEIIYPMKKEAHRKKFGQELP